MRPSNAKTKATTLLRWAGTLIALGLLVWLLSRQGWNEIAENFRAISVWRVLAAFGLTMLSRLAVTARWHVLLRSAGVKTTYGQSLRITFAGLFASNFLPTTVGGDVARLGGGLRLGFDGAIALSSLVVDRLVGMAAYAMAVPFGLPAFVNNLPEIVRSLSRSQICSDDTFDKLSAGFSRFCDEATKACTERRSVATTSQIRDLLSLQRPDRFPQPGSGVFWPQALCLSSAVSGKGNLSGLTAALRKVFDALAIWLHKPGALLLSLAFSWLRMICDFSTISVLLGGMGERLSFWLIAGLTSIVYFVTLIPVSINGIGWMELSVTGLFTLVGGVSAAGAGVLAVFLRILPMIASLPGALFVGEMVAGKKRDT